MKAMTFNVQYNDPGARLSGVRDMIRREAPDTLCMQECTQEWVDYLSRELADEYACADIGPLNNHDPGGACAVFYRTDKFRLLDRGPYWLSDTPDVPSMFPETRWTRVLVYTLLERIEDGRKMLVASLHMQTSPNMVRVFLDFIDRYPDLPIITTGDFNIHKGHELYHRINETRLTDAAEIAKITKEVSTCHAYQHLEQILDHIFVTDADIAVDRYDVLDETVTGGYLSDHYPVLIEYHFKNDFRGNK